MKVIIDSSEFIIESINTLSRNRNYGVYYLQGLDDELTAFAKNSIEKKGCFNIKVLEKNRQILSDEDCFFNDLNILNKMIKLTVNWVDV